MNLKKCIMLIMLAIFCISVSGCGETLYGVGKDFRRVGKGIKTIFVRDIGD